MKEEELDDILEKQICGSLDDLEGLSPLPKSIETKEKGTSYFCVLLLILFSITLISTIEREIQPA